MEAPDVAPSEAPSEAPIEAPNVESSDTSLVGDLESLRGLLNETTPAPLLEDPGEFPPHDDAPQRPAKPDSLGDDTIKALLGDEWRQSADQILSAAREAIEHVSSDWSPQHTTELNEALRVRIDATLEAWLEAAVRQRLEELRATLLAAIESEIATFTAQLTQQDPDGE
jgi:hypothetical protein